MSEQPPTRKFIAEMQAGHPPSPSSRLLGFRLLALDPAKGVARIGYQAREAFCNPMGVIQGGFLTAMIDEAMAIACVAMSDTPIYVPTLELNTSFINPGHPGPMIATGQVIRLGKSVAFTEGSLVDGEETLLLRASATCRITPVSKFEAAKKPRDGG